MAESGREMRLVVTTPAAVVIGEPVRSVQTEDASGRLGIEPGHEHFLTTTVASILLYRPTGGGEKYAAVDRGILRVSPGRIELATRQAVVSDDLDELSRIVEQAVVQERESRRRAGKAFGEIELSAWRTIMDYEQHQARS